MMPKLSIGSVHYSHRGDAGTLDVNLTSLVSTPRRFFDMIISCTDAMETRRKWLVAGNAQFNSSIGRAEGSKRMY